MITSLGDGSKNAMDVEVEQSRATIRLTGELRVTTARRLHDELTKLATNPDVLEVVLDFEGLTDLDSSGIAVISLGAQRLEAAGRHLSVEHVSDDHREALALMPALHDDDKRDQGPGIFARIGAWGYDSWAEIVAYFAFVGKLLQELGGMIVRRERPPKNSVIEQAVIIGVDAFPIIGLSSALMGLVLGFQAADQLVEFGATVYVANLVGVSMAREFGPLMTGIILAGRSGSAIAAEIGTMKVQEELDALRTMGLEPSRYLAIPKMLAITVVGPSLTLLSIVLGMFGGLLIGVFYVDMTPTLFFMRTMEAVDPVDIWHGLWKSLIFAWLVGSIACFCGFRIQGGASGVGRATTRAVVMGIFLLIVADAIGTSLSTVAGGWL